MQLSGLDLYLWVTSFLANLILLLALWFTVRARRFPMFTALIAMNVIRTIALFVIFHEGNKLAYFYAYWSFGILDVCVQVLVIGESATRVFRPGTRWVPGAFSALAFLMVTSTVVASFTTWLASPSTHYLRQFLVIKGNFFSSVLVSCLFVGLLTLSFTMDLPLQTDAAKVLQGLGIFSLVGIAVQGLQTFFGVTQHMDIFLVLEEITKSLYIACVMYWIVAFRKKAHEPQELPDRMRQQLLVLNDRVMAELRNLQSLGR